jgi:hypothetical protein
VLWFERRGHGSERSHPLDLRKAYYMPKIKNLNLQRFYIEVMVKKTIFAALQGKFTLPLLFDN